MAILKIEKHERYTLNGMIEYLRDDTKHNQQVYFFNSIYASPNKPLLDMMIVKMLHEQVGGRQYRQMVLSLTEEESCPEYYNAFLAASWKAAVEIARYFKCQVVFAIHANTDNIHTHFVLNSVSFYDGRKIQISKADTKNLKDLLNGILQEFGFNKVYYYKPRALETAEPAGEWLI